jgi:hypothetical protein
MQTEIIVQDGGRLLLNKKRSATSLQTTAQRPKLLLVTTSTGRPASVGVEIKMERPLPSNRPQEERDMVHYANVEEMYRRQAIIADRLSDLVAQLAVIDDRQKRMFEQFNNFEREVKENNRKYDTKMNRMNANFDALNVSSKLLATKKIWTWGLVTGLAAILLWFATISEKLLVLLGKK